jgi:molybdopterin biosynthesis enzyme MoaB
MLIRTGILTVPQPNEAASLGVYGQLRQIAPGAQLLQEKSCAGPRPLVEEILRRWCDEEELDLVITIGGTLPAPGPSGAECVPEATLAVVERLLPGLSEEMRAVAREVSPLALLDRSVAGIRGRSLVLNLPAGERSALLFFEAVAPLIGPLLAYLQEEDSPPWLEDALAEEANQSRREDTTDEESALSASVPSGRLRSEEFAAFLARK